MLTDVYINEFPDIEVIDYVNNQMLPFGVCDNFNQILERDFRISEYIDDSDSYVLHLEYIDKNLQPKKEGFRWDKWGAYIGDYKPKYIYLYDEEDIPGVYIYQLYKVI